MMNKIAFETLKLSGIAVILSVFLTGFDNGLSLVSTLTIFVMSVAVYMITLKRFIIQGSKYKFIVPLVALGVVAVVFQLVAMWITLLK